MNFKEYLKSLEEDAPVNSVGGGNIAGAGVGPDGEPGISQSSKDKYRKKNKKEAPKNLIWKPIFQRKTLPDFMNGK